MNSLGLLGMGYHTADLPPKSTVSGQYRRYPIEKPCPLGHFCPVRFEPLGRDK